MKAKMKMLLFTVVLCLMTGLQSMEMVHAAVYFEACPFCGTRVERNEYTKIERMVRLGACTEHRNCEIYEVVYGVYRNVTCQTIGCDGYNAETLLRTSSPRELHIDN